jgi:hypothetical protein
MPLFICRWQNGDFSAVSASSKKDAIELLDEVGNAETCELCWFHGFAATHSGGMLPPFDFDSRG